MPSIYNKKKTDHLAVIVYCPVDEEYGEPLYRKGACFRKNEVVATNESKNPSLFSGAIVKYRFKLYRINDYGWTEIEENPRVESGV